MSIFNLGFFGGDDMAVNFSTSDYDPYMEKRRYIEEMKRQKMREEYEMKRMYDMQTESAPQSAPEPKKPAYLNTKLLITQGA